MKSPLSVLIKLLKKNLLIYKFALKVYRLIKTNYEIIKYFTLYNIFRFFPINYNKIIFCNYYGNGYGDNSKYIVEKLIELERDYDMVWLLRKELINNNTLPSQIRPVKYGSIRAIYEMATAKIWVDNCRKPSVVRKRNNQFYIQTWHGCIPIKRVEKDVENNLDNTYIQNAKKDSKLADLFISNSKFCTNLYRSAFWYDGKILECGTPRCDILINGNKSNIQEKVRSHFNISNNTKILIYAPTFRVDYSTNAYNVDFNKLIKTLENKFNSKWVVLVRLHPNISTKSDFINYSSTVINATNYDDMYELLSVSDILLTDYSSTMFEFSYTLKPVFLYASDIKTYNEDRSFYFNIQSLPYPLAENNSQLIKALDMFDVEKYKNELVNFFSKLGIFEQGVASTKVVEIIDREMKSGN